LALYQGQTGEVRALRLRHGELQAAIARAEEAWLEAQAAMD